MPHFWSEADLNMVNDMDLRRMLEAEQEHIEDDYEYAFDMIKNYKHLIDPAKFTLETFTRAFTMVMTRSFGWNIPFNMLVPFADNINHHCVESYHQLFNARL